MVRWRRTIACVSLMVPVAAIAQTGSPPPSDYPTAAVADYVFACTAANGESREMVERCSCSIDVISTLLPYEAYEEAEAFLSLAQVVGERGVLFRTSEPAKDAVSALRRAQVEAELRCF